MSIPLSEQIQAEIDRRNQVELQELVPLTIQLLESLVRGVPDPSHLQEQSTFLLKRYRQLTRSMNRSISNGS